MVNEQTLPQIVGVLLASIRDLPLIAEKVCYSLAQLAAGFKDADTTSLLSPYFKDIVGALLNAVRMPAPLHLLCPIFPDAQGQNLFLDRNFHVDAAGRQKSWNGAHIAKLSVRSYRRGSYIARLSGGYHMCHAVEGD